MRSVDKKQKELQNWAFSGCADTAIQITWSGKSMEM